MRNKKRKKAKFIIICKKGALVATMTEDGLRMMPMGFGNEPHHFQNEEQALSAILRNKIMRDLEVIETKEW